MSTFQIFEPLRPFTYSEAISGDVDTYTSRTDDFGQATRAFWVLDTEGNYIWQGHIESGGPQDSSDVIPFTVPLGYLATGYSLVITNELINSGTTFFLSELSSPYYVQKNLSTFTSSDTIPAGQYTLTLGNGTVVLDYQFSLNLVSIANKAPTLSGLGNDPSFTENGSAVTLFSGTGISAVEPEQGIASITLTVGNIQDGAAEGLLIDGTWVPMIASLAGTTATNGMAYEVSVSQGVATITLGKAGGVSPTVMNTLINQISYRNDSEAPGEGERTVTITRIKDTGGMAEGGVDTAVTSLVSTVTVTAVNDAPVITEYDDLETRLIPDKGGPVLIDLGTPVTITDTDSPNFDGGTLRVWIDHHLQADDYLGIRTGSGVELSAGVTVGSIVTVDGQNIGTIGQAVRSDVIVHFNAQSTPALASKLFQNFTFDTLGEVTGGRVIKFTVTDGDGGQTTSDFASMVVVNQLTVDISADLLALKAGETATVTFTFSQDTEALSLDDISVQGGTLSNLRPSAPRTYTAKFTPDSNTQDVTAAVYIDANKIPGQSVPSAASNTLIITADTKLPTIESIEREVSADEVTNADSLVYRVTFSEPVTGVDSGDFVVHGPVGAAVSGIAMVGGGVYSVTVSGGDLASFDGEVALELSPDANIIDAAGNKVDALAQPQTSEGYLLDNTGPTSTDIEFPQAGTYTAGETLDFIVTFDEPVRVIDAPELVLALGDETVYAQYMWGAESDTLTFRYTVQTGDLDVDGLDVEGFHFANGQLVDALGNLAQYTFESPPANVVVDALNPSVVSVSVPENAIYKAGQELAFTVSFDEPVTVNTDLGTPSIELTLDSGGKVQANYGSGSGTSALRFSYTVQAGNADTNGVEIAGEISLNGGSIKDAAGNISTLVLNNVGSTSGVLVSAVAPTVTAIERVGSERVTDDSVQYQVTFSERITGVDAEDFTLVLEGVTAQIASVVGDDGPFSDTYTVTIDNINGEGTLRLDLNSSGTGIVSEYDNAIEGGYAGGQAYSVDTVLPMLAVPITISNTALKIGETATVTFAFTEAVTGFTVDDVTVPNGALSDLASSDNGRTWTATLTPSDNSTALTNVLTLDFSGVADMAGNAGIGSADSPAYKVDTMRPTLAAGITISDANLKAGNTAVVTFTFNEAVTGFDTADVTVPNGTLSELKSNDGGRVWTASLTPDEETREASNVLLLDYSGITDLAGNAGEGTSASFNYTVDTILPRLALPIAISDTALKIDDTATVTFVFTEAVGGFTKEAVTVSNGTLSEVASEDGITWTATLTPAEGASASTNVLSLDYSGIVTLSGNGGSGTAESDNYTVDTVAPTTAVSLDVTSLKAGATAAVTFTFSEEPQDFTLEDVTAQGGTLSNLSDLVDNGDGTWSATAVFTPAVGHQSESNIITVDTNWTDVAGNAPEAPAVSVNYVVDTVPPTAPIIAPIELSNNAKPVITGNAEPGSSVIVTVGGVTYTVRATDEGWTLDLGAAEPTSGELSLNVNGENLVSAIARDEVGNESGAGSQTLVIDSTAPTVTVTLDTDSLKAGEQALVTFSFTEQPLNFSLADVSVEGGELDNLSELVEHDNGTWSATAIFTPLPNIEVAATVISVGTDWADAAGNAPVESMESDSFAIDTVPPTVPGFTSKALTHDTTPVISGTAQAGASVIVTVGGATYIVQADADGWTLDLGEASPDSGNLSLNFNGANPVVAIARDAAGNESEAGMQTLVIDSTAPAVAVTLDRASLKAGEQALVTFTFAEQPKDFSLEAVTAEGGQLSNLSGPVEIGGIWSATAIFTPSDDLEQAENVITVRADWTDLAGNAPTDPAQSDNYVIDTSLPSAPGFESGTLSNDTGPVLAGTADEGTSVIVTVGGATYTVQATEEGWTLDLGVEPTSGELSLNVNGENLVTAIARDAAGNESEAASQTLVIDTTPPSVLIAISDTNLTVRETATVTFTFDEAPHGFSLDDVTAEGGQLSILSDLVENDDGTWSATAVFTPTPNMNDRTNVITIGTEWADAAGNAPLEAAVSGNYVINTQLPEPVTPPVTPPVIPPVDQWVGLPDGDGDGIPESVENLVPGMAGGVVGDGNGDGIADVLQTDVSSLPWAQSPDGSTRFVTLTNGSGLAQLSVKPLEVAPNQVPSDLNLPLGLLAFKVDKVPESGSVDFTVYLDSDIPVNGYWKEINGEWVDIATSISTEGGKTKITFSIEDGGRFDADGVKNGTIVDPGAPGWRAQADPDADGDQFPDALEAANGLTPGVKDNDVFASTKLFVMQLYRDFLYREAEPEGLAYWQARLDSGELTREDVTYTFLFASEFQDNAGAVARLYMGTYDRIPDNEGMHYWVDALQEGQSLTQVAEQFAASDEFAELYGDLDNEGFVSELYLNVQEREAEAEGRAWWVSQLEAGMSRGEVLVRFTQSEEFLANSRDEVAVTLNYVGLLDRTPNQAGFDYWLNEIVAGRSEIEVIGQFIGTDEYHDRFLPVGAEMVQINAVGQSVNGESEPDMLL